VKTNSFLPSLTKHHATKLASAMFCASCFLASVTSAFGQLFGTNLIQNGDAEQGAASPDGSALVPIPGWTTTDNFNVISYSSGQGWPVASDPGPADRGNNLFVGGRPSALSTATQKVSISSWAATVDGVGVTYNLSAWLGGYSSQLDNAVLEARFIGSEGLISGATIGPVLPADRSGVTSLIFRETSGVIPQGTRDIEFVLTATRLAGSDNDGYADNLSFTANAVPEPESYAAFAAVCALGFATWRKLRPTKCKVA
jgi:hypothetical protein